MFTALLHVGADFLRSTSTVVMSMLLLSSLPKDCYVVPLPVSWFFPNAQQKGSRFKGDQKSVRLCPQWFAKRSPWQSKWLRNTYNCRHFLDFELQKMPTVMGIGGSWPRSADLLSLCDLRLVVGCEAQTRHHFWTCVWSLHLTIVNSHRDWGGRLGCETQNCRHFWNCVWSSYVKSLSSRRDRGGPGCEAQNCRHLWTCVWSS